MWIRQKETKKVKIFEQEVTERTEQGLTIFDLGSPRRTRWVKPGCFFESWFSLDELVELFGLGLVVGEGAKEVGASGPDFLFVVHLRVVGDLLELAGGGEGSAGRVEFEDAAVMVKAVFCELELTVALFGAALFELFGAKVAVVARQDLEGGGRKFDF